MAFYHGILGIPLDKQDGERTYLQMEREHLVLQIENSTGRHQGGGPLHFAMTVSEEEFEKFLASLKGTDISRAGLMARRGRVVRSS
ncbi:MAG: hypothetical protein VYD85_15280 [Pseudomonadota bacterium]|nr:hypothetical protein [Pseudomonadota bacterium]